MVMMTDKEKRTYQIVGIVAVVIVAAYLVSAFAGWIPDEYNVFKGQQQVTPEPPTYAAGEGYVMLSGNGTVNVTIDPEYVIDVTVGCNESYLGGMTLALEVEDSDSDVWFTASDVNWQISDDGLEATWIGTPLSNGIEITSLYINIDNTDLTAAASMTVTASATIGDLEEDTFEIAFEF